MADQICVMKNGEAVEQLPVMISRGALYFNIMESLLFVVILGILRNPIHKALYIMGLLMIAITLMYQSIQAYPDLFDPYKSLWYNENFHRVMY